MPRFAALLRAVNLPSHGKLAMADLRALLEELGFADVQTALQSGNAIFSSPRSAKAVEQVIERALLARFDVKTSVFVRSGAELDELIARNPFPREAVADPGHLVVVFLDAAPAAVAVDALRAAIRGPEVVRAAGRHLYVTYPAGIGDSKLTALLIERKLGVRGTGRNWNTVCKLNALTGGEAKRR